METIIINLDNNESLSNIAEYSLTCNISNETNQKIFKAWLKSSFSYDIAIYNHTNHIIFVNKETIIGCGKAMIASIETYVGDENRMEVSLVYDYYLNINNSPEMRKLIRDKKINQLI